MEPIRGRRLVKSIPPVVQELWDSAAVQRTPADWALQWVWDQPKASVVLSGMSAMEHVEQNIASASRSKIGALSEEEQAISAHVREKFDELCPIPCTDCRYCLPCPNPIGRASGRSGVVLSATVSGAKRTRSAGDPLSMHPRSGKPKRLAGKTSYGVSLLPV
jgi:hypothetical protein